MLKKTLASLLAIVPFLTAPSHAATEVFNFSISDQPALFGNTNMANLTITESGGGTLWQLSALWDPVTYQEAFIKSLDFDTSKKFSYVISGFTSTANTVGAPTIKNTGLQFETANNSDSRFTGFESASWNIASSSLSNFVMKDLHINALTTSGGSVKFTPGPAITSPVPEPQTYMMMLAGLGLIGWMARNKSRNPLPQVHA